MDEHEPAQPEPQRGLNRAGCDGRRVPSWRRLAGWGGRGDAGDPGRHSRRGAPALLWDKENMKFTNISDANQNLTRKYSDGWKVTGA
jgi:hypothetical protein